jgi:hypothetical protein
MRILVAAALIGAAVPCLAQVPGGPMPDPALQARAAAPAFDLYGEDDESRRWKARVDGLVASICGTCGPSTRHRPPRAGSAPASQEDAVARALDDHTLQRGDLVMLPDGLKVFRGGPEPFAPASLGAPPKVRAQHPGGPPGPVSSRARPAASISGADASAAAGERTRQLRVVYPGPVPP